MNTQDTRLMRLKSLVSEFKGQAEFARTYDLDAAFISQMINGFRKISEKTARKLEEKTNKPPMWMDYEDDIFILASSMTKEDIEFFSMLKRCPDWMRSQTKDNLKAFLVNSGDEEPQL